MSTRREWRPFQAELARSGSWALWGLWALCIFLLSGMVFAVAGSLVDLAF